jgi:arylsulfatase A
MQRSKSRGVYATLKAISSLQLVGFLTINALAAPKPNIIVMLIDDMGVHDGEPFDSRYFKTPQMTRFAKEGVKFTQAYAAAAVCSPTRAALMTGKNPARLHLTDYIPGENGGKNALLKIPDWQKSLPKDEVTLAEALKQCGYRSASIGKWHLGGTDSLPGHHGFDLNIAGAAAGHPASFFWPYGKANDTKTSSAKGSGIATLKQQGQEGEYLTDRLTDEAIQFIETSKDQPFFLYLPHYAVHDPLMGKKDLVEAARQVPPADGQENAIYHAMITSVDQSLGRILDTLEKLKLSDHTIVIFTSDNGGVIHAGKPPATCNAPQRLGKGYAYEGGLRVPLIIKVPGLTKPGSTSAVPVITQDFFPTLLALADPRGEVKCPTFDGMNILPALKGEEKPIHDQLCWHYPHYWGGGRVTPYSVIRRGDMKLIRFWETGKEELYDLAKDPSETTDLAAHQPQIRADLTTRLDAWLKDNHAQIPQKK